MTPARSSRRVASRWFSRPSRLRSLPGSRKSSPSRRSASGPDGTATARSSSTTICSASIKGGSRVSSSATPSSRQRSRTRSNAMRPTCARAPSPATSTLTRSPTRTWPPSSAARKRNQKRKRDDNDSEQHEGERDDSAEQAPTLDHADPVDEEPERPGGEQRENRVEDGDRRAGVAAPRAKRVAPVDGEANGPDEDEPEDERSSREGEQLTRASVAPPAAGPLEPDVERRASDPVGGGTVDRAGQEEEDREHGGAVVDELLVEKTPRRGGHQHGGETGEEHEREHRLLPRLDLVFGFVPQGLEDDPRALKDRERSQPPLAVGAGLGGARRPRVH